MRAHGTRPDVTGSQVKSCVVTGLRVDATTYADARSRIVTLARAKEGQYICAANVHMAMEAHEDANFREVVEGAALVTPDGVPLVWMMRRLGQPNQTRVYGPKLMLVTLQAAEQEGLKIGFYGGSPEDLELIVKRLGRDHPRLEVGYAYSPPFRTLTADEEAADIAEIRRSGIDILFVGLGCPKQELWMARHTRDLSLVALGVGAGFAFYAGTVRQAPTFLQRAGLEWAFRLIAEPSRLWRRYLKHNPKFMMLAIRQLWRNRQ